MNSRRLKPSTPVTVGAVGGSPAGVVIVWALALAGIDVSAEVAAAIGSVVGAALAYFGRGGRAL